MDDICIRIMTAGRGRCTGTKANGKAYCGFHDTIVSGKGGPGIYAHTVFEDVHKLRIHNIMDEDGVDRETRRHRKNVENARWYDERQNFLQTPNGQLFTQEETEKTRLRDERARIMREQRQVRWEEMRDHRVMNALIEQVRNQRENARLQQQGRLAQLAGDKQSVHTAEVVKQVKDNIQRILQIDVPSEYKWNLQTLSRTPGEIIADCKLTRHAGCKMLTQYCDPTSIYEIAPGIYGKVLDAVWQYITHSDDAESLKKVVKQEMEDNVGMCAQGNLSRIVNIVVGVLDGMVQKESISEILGKLFPALMEIDDSNERIQKGTQILKENNVAPELWNDWLDPLA